MGRIKYCPIVGGQCKRSEPEIKVQKDTFFLAEPFQPEKERERRELAVKNALKEAMKEKFFEKSLRVSNKDPKEPAVFCGICRLIQSSAYGIVDISGLNPNVVLELGMMFSLGKPVFVLVKKGEEDDLTKKLPSDIVWKKVIPYDEYIDIVEELSKEIQNRPPVEPEPPLVEKTTEVIAEVNPSLAQKVAATLKEIMRKQEEKLKELLKEARLSKTILREKEIKISPLLETQIDQLCKKVEQVEKLVGLPENPKIAFLRGNWYHHREEYDKASDLYDWALILKPDFREAWGNKGVALDKLGKHEEAIVCFDKVIELKKDDELAWFNKGTALGKLGKHEAAIVCFDKAIELKKDDETGLS